MKLRYLTASLLAGGTLTAVSAPAHADVDPYLGQVVLTSISFCPRGFSEASGAVLAIASYQALYSLYGTTYGGDGRTTFALPDLRGRMPVHNGNGIVIGQKAGAVSATMTAATMPSHSHAVEASNRAGTLTSPSGADLAEFAGGAINGYSTGAPTQINMENDAVGPAGGGQSFNIRQPYLTMRWCVSMTGQFPPRN